MKGKLAKDISDGVVAAGGLARRAARSVSSGSIEGSLPARGAQGTDRRTSSAESHPDCFNKLISVLQYDSLLTRQAPHPAVIRFGMTEVIQSGHVEGLLQLLVVVPYSLSCHLIHDAGKRSLDARSAEIINEWMLGVFSTSVLDESAQGGTKLP